MITIAVLPGDGVGQEVLDGPIGILQCLADRGELATTGPWPVGQSAHAAMGDPLPVSTLQACETADAVLLGAIGDHPGVNSSFARPELTLIRLREHFDLRISIRQVWRGEAPPLTFVRNLLGGAYGSSGRRESDGTNAAQDLLELTPERVAELAGLAFDYAEELNLPLVSVDKANLLATSRLWRQIVEQEAAARHVQVRHVYVDRMAYELGRSEPPPAVILTEGLFGDILSDLASARAGSIALCGSGSIRPASEAHRFPCVGIFEPVHGSAPARAGQNVVNPCGGYLALAMLLDWFPDTAKWASVLRAAVHSAMRPPLTYDMAPAGEATASTSELSARINTEFASNLHVLT